MDDGCMIVLVVAGIIIAAIIAFFLVVYVILPATGIVIIGIGVAGSGWGAFVAGRNFYHVLIEAHQREK